MIKYFFRRTIRLLIAPVKGAIIGTREAWDVPRPTNLKEFIRDDIRRYFAPITGACAEIKKEWRRAD